jgi:hypothetical protein
MLREKLVNFFAAPSVNPETRSTGLCSSSSAIVLRGISVHGRKIQLDDMFNAIPNGGGILGIIGGGGFPSASAIFPAGKVVAQGFQERYYS